MSVIKIGKIREITPKLVSGKPRFEIWFNKNDASGIPYELGKRIEIDLIVGERTYKAGVRGTENNYYIWICPDINDENKIRLPLSQVLLEYGYNKNNDIILEFVENRAIITKNYKQKENINKISVDISNKVLLKSVGISQHQDGVRINKEFHEVFNPPSNKDYVSRGQSRLVHVKFNNNIFDAKYIYEGTRSTRTLQRIQFSRNLTAEFKKVFPNAIGFFSIKLDNDINNFIFKHDTENAYEIKNKLDEDIEKSISSSHAERLKRLQNSKKIPDTMQVTSIVYIRNPDVVAEVLYRSKGLCEKCNCNAPFLRRKNNTPYLEVHHKIPLSDGGFDVVENAIAVCPNCHRESHFG